MVVCRSLARSGALLERVLRSYGIPPARDRTIAAGAHRPRPLAARAGALRAARRRAGERRGSARATCARRGCWTLETVDALEAEVRRRGLRTAHDARCRVGPGAAGDRRAARSVRSRGRACPPGAAPARGAAPRGRRVLDADEELDARAAAAALEALAELRRSASGPPAAELDRAARGPASCRPGALPQEDARADRRAARDPCAALPRGARVRPVRGRVPGAAAASIRSCPTSAAASWRCAPGSRSAPREDALARERYLFYASCLARHRAGRAQLPQLRRGGQPRAALAVHRRRRRAVRAGVAERRRRRLLADVVWSAAEAPTARERWRSRLRAARLWAAQAGRGRLRAPQAGRGRLRAAQARGGGDADARRARARARAPPRGRLGRRARGVRRLPGQVAGRAPAPARRARGRERGARRAAASCTRCSSGWSAGSGRRSRPPRSTRRRSSSTSLAAEVPETLAPGRPQAVRAAMLRGIEADLRRYLRHEAADGCELGAPRPGAALRLRERGGRVAARGRARARETARCGCAA